MPCQTSWHSFCLDDNKKFESGYNWQIQIFLLLSKGSDSFYMMALNAQIWWHHPQYYSLSLSESLGKQFLFVLLHYKWLLPCQALHQNLPIPIWPFLFFYFGEDGVKLILGISGSLCACSSMTDPSLIFLGHALAGSVTGALLEMLKEALSPKPEQRFPARRKIKGEYSFYLFVLFWRSLDWTDSRNTLDLLFFKTREQEGCEVSYPHHK